MATPKGDLIPFSKIQLQDISIAHRQSRPVFDGSNAGHQIKATVSQHRIQYFENDTWPLLNEFPPHVHQNPTAKITINDFISYCPSFVVLPDYYKHWALVLQVSRSVSYRLDFNKEGSLASNFTPHGAAATVIDNTGTLRFVVWNRWQLHGDIGERLGLRRKWKSNEWQALMSTQHPGEPLKDAKGKTIQYWCAGDKCPKDYRMPEDWDVLGQLPQHVPKKRTTVVAGLSTIDPLGKKPRNDHVESSAPGLDLAGSASNPLRGIQTYASTRPQFPASSGFAPLQTPAAASMSDAPASYRFASLQTPPDAAASSLQIPAAKSQTTASTSFRMPNSWGRNLPITEVKVENERLKLETQELKTENTNMKTRLRRANHKFKILAMFASRHDNALWLLMNRLIDEQLKSNYDDLTTDVDKTIEGLRTTYPTLEKLITTHDDVDYVSETLDMSDWMDRDDVLDDDEAPE